ncbi:hypothetical protein FQN57_006301 [Myotisia sp. PD_48]|nr:hypothetical protein FQN57_006301 [Myotisia sp. PD_48]
MKTKRWVDAKTISYDGDDWGDSDIDDEYENPNVDAPRTQGSNPASNPAGPWQHGESGSQQIPRFTQNSHPGRMAVSRNILATHAGSHGASLVDIPESASAAPLETSRGLPANTEDRKHESSDSFARTEPTQLDHTQAPAQKTTGFDSAPAFIRPADIYKRMEQEREKERLRKQQLSTPETGQENVVSDLNTKPLADSSRRSTEESDTGVGLPPTHTPSSSSPSHGSLPELPRLSGFEESFTGAKSGGLDLHFDHSNTKDNVGDRSDTRPSSYLASSAAIQHPSHARGALNDTPEFVNSSTSEATATSPITAPESADDSHLAQAPPIPEEPSTSNNNNDLSQVTTSVPLGSVEPSYSDMPAKEEVMIPVEDASRTADVTTTTTHLEDGMSPTPNSSSGQAQPEPTERPLAIDTSVMKIESQKSEVPIQSLEPQNSQSRNTNNDMEEPLSSLHSVPLNETLDPSGPAVPVTMQEPCQNADIPNNVSNGPTTSLGPTSFDTPSDAPNAENLPLPGSNTDTAQTSRTLISQDNAPLSAPHEKYEHGEAAFDGVVNVSPSINHIQQSDTAKGQQLQRKFSWETDLEPSIDETPRPQLPKLHMPGATVTSLPGPPQLSNDAQISGKSGNSGNSGTSPLAPTPTLSRTSSSPKTCHSLSKNRPPFVDNTIKSAEASSGSGASNAEEKPFNSNHPLHAIPQRVPDFREIMKMPLPSQRIAAFREAREAYALINTGMGDWVKVVIERHPEHSELAIQNGVVALDANFPQKVNHSRSKFPKLSSLGHHDGIGASPGHTRHGSGIPLGSMMNTQQVQAKGKDLLHSAGVLGGKAGGAAKGLFAKGRNKFRHSGGVEKVQNPSASAEQHSSVQPNAENTHPNITDNEQARQKNEVAPKVGSLRLDTVPFSLTLGNSIHKPSLTGSVASAAIAENPTNPASTNNFDISHSSGNAMNTNQVSGYQPPVFGPNTPSNSSFSQPTEGSMGIKPTYPILNAENTHSPSTTVRDSLPESSSVENAQISQSDLNARRTPISSISTLGANLVGSNDGRNQDINSNSDTNLQGNAPTYPNRISPENGAALPALSRKFSFEESRSIPSEPYNPIPSGEFHPSTISHTHRPTPSPPGVYTPQNNGDPPVPPVGFHGHPSVHPSIASYWPQSGQQNEPTNLSVHGNSYHNDLLITALPQPPHGFRQPYGQPGYPPPNDGVVFNPQPNIPTFHSHPSRPSSSAEVSKPHGSSTGLSGIFSKVNQVGKKEQTANTSPLSGQNRGHLRFRSLKLDIRSARNKNLSIGRHSSLMVGNSGAVSNAPVVPVNPPNLKGGLSKIGSLFGRTTQQSDSTPHQLQSPLTEGPISPGSSISGRFWHSNTTSPQDVSPQSPAARSKYYRPLGPGLSQVTEHPIPNSLYNGPHATPIPGQIVAPNPQYNGQHATPVPGHILAADSQYNGPRATPIPGHIVAANSQYNGPYAAPSPGHINNQNFSPAGYSSYNANFPPVPYPSATPIPGHHTHPLTTETGSPMNSMRPTVDPHTAKLHLRSRSPLSGYPDTREYDSSPSGTGDPAHKLGTFHSAVPNISRIGDQETPWNIAIPSNESNDQYRDAVNYPLPNSAVISPVNPAAADFPPPPPPKSPPGAVIPLAGEHGSIESNASRPAVPNQGRLSTQTGDTLPIDHPTNDDSSEEIIMSSTAYPGQEWQPSYVGNWD